MADTEEYVTYEGVNAHIRIPDNPSGLVFIAPGALVSTESPLINAIQNAFEDRGMATVIADIGISEVKMDDPTNVHGDFSKNLQTVIDGYYSTHDYTPDTFELAGHSMGGAASLSITPDNPVSAITVFDPTPAPAERLSQIEAPVTIAVSQIRSFKAAGHRALERLGGSPNNHSIYELNTSQERHSGHMFVGAEDEIARIILNHSDDRDTDPSLNTLDL